MADSVSTPRASGLGLRFIENDPVSQAWQDSEKHDLAMRTGEAGLEGKNLENEYHRGSMGSRLRQVDAAATHTELGNEYDRGSMPSRLRSVEAGADTARAGADVATQTVPAHVSQAYSGARTAGAGADVAEGTVEPRISQAQSASRSAGTSAELGERKLPFDVQNTEAGARSATSNANVTEQTEPARVQQANAHGRQAEAAATHATMQNFHEVIKLAEAGDIEGAHALAQAGGQQIPPGLLENADVRAALVQASKRAQELYPNRPADQQRYVHGFMSDMATRRAEGGAAGEPTAIHNVPGAPTPQEQAGTHNYELLPGTENGVAGVWKHDKRTGERTFEPNATVSSKAGAGGRPGQTETIIAELRKENPSLSYAEALALTKRAPNGDQATLRREALALSAAKADIDFITNPGGTLERYRKKYGLSAGPSNAPAAVTPAVQPAPAPRATTPAPAPQQPAGGAQIDQEGSLRAAREALQRNPAAREQIIQRLIENGIDPAGL